MKTPQYELAGSASVFNLAGETGLDPFRIERERWAEAERKRDAQEYAARMQHTFEQCPGFIGGDAPTSVNGRGVVVVEPGRIVEALAWLKRRFHASETIDVDTDLQGIAVEVAPRVRRAMPGGRRIKVSFGKVEQFTLAL
jgi:hypothetical protein